MKKSHNLTRKLRIAPGKKVSLKDHDPGWTGDIRKEDAKALLASGVDQLRDHQEMLYAQDTYAVLVIFQAMDAAGKDGAIEHVMSGVNPQGCQVFSFKAPSAEERDHSYLWRSFKALPERGRIGIHNRSHYEEVLVARVHPEILQSQQLPAERKGPDIWRERFRQISDFERYLYENGTIPIKFFLHVSRKEQKKRFLERIDKPKKNWKFSFADAKERLLWKDYMNAYEDALSHTSTKYAPWYVVPADNKWFTRLAVADIINDHLAKLDLSFPTVTAERRKELLATRKILVAEK